MHVYFTLLVDCLQSDIKAMRKLQLVNYVIISNRPILI